MVTLICCARSAPKLLVHVSLLLAIISGAGLATLARLKWDPSTYLVVRGLLPTEYRVLSGVLCFGSILLIVLAHLAVIALSIRKGSHQHFRQAMFFTYSAMMTALIIVELVTIGWQSVRVYKWLQTDEANFVIQGMHDIEEWGPTVQGVVEFAAHFSELLKIVHESIPEIKHDLPYNVYVGVVFVMLVAILQPVAVVLALNAAFTYSKAADVRGDSTKVVHTIRYNSNQRKSFQNENKEKKIQA